MSPFMTVHQQLPDLESQLYWCWHRYLLRVWQDCGSFESASDFDRLQIAEQMRADAEGRSKEWALAGLTNLVDHLNSKLDDLVPVVRQEAAIALGDFCRQDHPAIDVLIERLRSPEQTPHDRACAAWALGRIGAKSFEVMPILLALIEDTKDKVDADGLRRSAAEAIERLTDDIDVLVTVSKHCLQDRFWKCRMHGLFLVERILKRQPDLRDGFVPLIEPLVKDELEEIREEARRVLIGFEEDV
jgi:HEAT repeat protein